MQYNVTQYNAMQCNAMQYNATQCNAMQCNAMQCNAIQRNTIHHLVELTMLLFLIFGILIPLVTYECLVLSFSMYFMT